MIIQNVAKDKGETDVTFTVPRADLRARRRCWKSRRRRSASTA
jgi:aspartate kinase